MRRRAPGQPGVTLTGTGLLNVLATGDHLVAWAMRAVEFLARSVGVEVDLDAHGVEPDGLRRNVAGAPNGGDVDVGLELQLQAADHDVTGDGVRVDADGEAGTEGGERGLRGVRRRVVAQQARRLVDDVGRQVADHVEVPEAALGDGAAFQGS